MADRLLDEFLDFLKPYLVGSKELTKLIKLRFVETDEKFRNSVDFSRLIHSCRANIQKNKERPYVYIKDFVSELKAYRKKSSKQKKPHKRKHDTDSDVPSKKLHAETDSSEKKANEKDVTEVDDVTQSDVAGNNADFSDRTGTKEIRLSEFTGDPEVSSTWSPSVSPRSRVKAEDDVSLSPSKAVPDEDYKYSDDPDARVSDLKGNSDKVPIDLTLSKVETSEVEVSKVSTPKPSLDCNSSDSVKSEKTNSNIGENKSVSDENVCSKPRVVDTDALREKEALAANPKPSIDLTKDCIEISEASTSNYTEIKNKSPDFENEENSTSSSLLAIGGTLNSKEAIPFQKGKNSTCKGEENTVKSSEKADNSASTHNEAEQIEPSFGKGDYSASICNEAGKGSVEDNNSISTYEKVENTVKSSEKSNDAALICTKVKSTEKSSEKGNNFELTFVQKHDDASEGNEAKTTSKLESDVKVSQEKISKNKNAEPVQTIFSQEEVLQGLKLAPKRVELLPAKPSTSTPPTAFALSNNTSKSHAENTAFLSEHKTVVNDKHIRRLEILLAKLSNEIEKVKGRELTLDELEDDDSSYMYEDKLQKKFVKVWDKLCELKGRRKTTGRPIEQRFTYEGTRYPEVNKKIESFINKKKIFPDFHDIRNIITKANKKKSLNLSSKLIEMVARDAFTDVGNQLQERRKEDFLTTFGCRITDDMIPNSDPAIKDIDLKQKLEQNRKEGKQKLDQVISKYSEEQITRGEEPEEVGDQSDEEKRETSCSPTNEEEEIDIPELIEDHLFTSSSELHHIIEDPEKMENEESAIIDKYKLKENIAFVTKEKELNNAKDKMSSINIKAEIAIDEIINDGLEKDVKKNYKRTKYKFDHDEKVGETESDNSVVELSTDEQEDEDQSDDINDEQSDTCNDGETPHLPKTFASVLTMMNIHENLDSPCSSESKSIKGVVDVDEDSINTESSTGIYFDVAEDSDLPSINETSTSESSDGDITEVFKPVLNNIKSPAKSAPTWKLSIRTPQKRLIRKALGLKPPSRSPKSINVAKKRPSVCIVDEPEITHSHSSKRFKISLNASFTAETTKKVKTMKSTASSSSEVIPIDDAIISSSTGDPDKGDNYVDDDDDDDDIIVLD